MVKKVFALALGLVLSMGAMAQMGPGNPTVSQSDIQFWTGTGTNRAVIAVTWEDDNEDYIGIAWGVQWNGGSIMLKSLMDTIAAYDSRFTMDFSNNWVNNLSYVDTEFGLNLVGIDGWWWYNWLNSSDVAYPSSGVTYDMVQNGDFVDWMQMGLADTMIMASDPNAPSAVTSDTITASEITYWVGEGNYEVIFAVNWPDTALAWGYRFSARSTNLQQVMNDIATADPRVRFVTGSYGIDDILFIENGDTLHKASGSWWEHTLNGQMSVGVSQQVNGGDFSRWADPTSGVVVDSTYDSQWNYWMYTYAYPQTIHPVTAPTPQDATIGVEDILFWVGEGQNSVIFAVNWVDTALAWGFRYDTTATVLDAMDAIAAADSRFSYVTGSYGIDDILFVENGDTLRKAQYSWWEHSINGSQSMGAYQPLADGDFSRWADPMAGVLVDSVYDSQWDYWMYIYAYPSHIYPAHNPSAPVRGPFCGAVGTEGCTAVKFDDTRIKGWATACTVVRGSQNLSNPEAPVVTYGTENDAVGPATTSTMDVVSLGDGGTATLTFARPIANGDGPDFVVFENSFSDTFLELAVVEVSTDGETFVRFPATSLTQTDIQITDQMGVDPTYINNLAGKYRVGYGTPFDLAELADSTGIDIDNINYVRIIDVVGSIDSALGTRDAFGHMINDPFPTISYSAGFDLDGVAVLHDATSGIADADVVVMAVYPNPVVNFLTVVSAQNVNAILYDLTGLQVASYTLQEGSNTLDLSALPAGIYMLSAEGTVSKVVKK